MKIRDPELRAPETEELRACLERAAAEPERARVSVLLTSPSEHGFAELGKIPLLVREARQRADRALGEVGVEGTSRERVLAPLAELEERSVLPTEAALPPLPWSLALWLEEDDARGWALSARHPDLVSPFVAVSRAPRVLPLLRGMALERRFRVLALGARRVALFEGDRGGLREVDAPRVPSTLEDALGHRIAKHDDAQLHLTSRAGQPGMERGAAVHHGHGGAPAERSVDLERFHRVVADAVARHWRGREDLPLVLLADARHQGRFRKGAALPGLLERGVEASPEHLSTAELHRLAWPVVQALVDSEAGDLARELERAPGAGERFVDRLEPLARRAVEGRVEHLWVVEGGTRPGRILESAGGTLVAGWPGEDALDQLATLVLRRGGAVHVVEAAVLSSAEGVAGRLRGQPAGGQSSERK